jgi:hypothetical protein
MPVRALSLTTRFSAWHYPDLNCKNMRHMDISAGWQSTWHDRFHEVKNPARGCLFIATSTTSRLPFLFFGGGLSQFSRVR